MRAASMQVRKGLWICSLLALALTGCSNSKLYPVQGRVTFPDGSPVTAGLVVFQGKVGDESIMARGDIQPDGSYRLGTHKPGDGVPLGKYQAIVTVPDPVDRNEPRRGPAIDHRFMDAKTSGLAFEVKPGTNECPIQVTAPQLRQR